MENIENTLEDFGKLLITEVRDSTLRRISQIIKGDLKSKSALQLHSRISINNDISLIEDVAIEVIDAAIFRLLRIIEQEELTLVFNEHDIETLSDGLCGELFTEDGWIEKYSHYKSSDR